MANGMEAREGLHLLTPKDSLLGTQVDRQIYEAGLPCPVFASITAFWDLRFCFLVTHFCLLTLNPPVARVAKFWKTLPTASFLSFLTRMLGSSTSLL